MTATPHELRDTLLEGASAEQRRKGLLPTPEANQRVFEPLLARHEAERSASATPESPAREEPRHERLAREADKLGVEFSTTLVKNKAATLAPLNQRELIAAKLFEVRLARMWRDPTWQKRILDVLNAGYREAMDAFFVERADVSLVEVIARRIYDLVELSNATWGDWRKVRGNPSYGLPSVR